MEFANESELASELANESELASELTNDLGGASNEQAPTHRQAPTHSNKDKLRLGDHQLQA